jgi:hypothetical protein
MSLNIEQPELNQGTAVFDVSDPERIGKIVSAGAEQSEVKFPDGAYRVVPNIHLRPAEALVAGNELEQPDPPAPDGLGQLNPSPSPIVCRGRDAMERRRRIWDDWLLIGEAIEEGRTEVMRILHTNKPTGRRYETLMGKSLPANGFKEIDKGTRKRLSDCLKHRNEIEKYRNETLSDAQRLAFNHPDTMLRKWRASLATPDLNAPPRISPIQKIKDELVKVIEERDCYKREIDRGGGDLWAPEDRPRDIAKIIVSKLNKAKAEKVAREILKALNQSQKQGDQ